MVTKFLPSNQIKHLSLVHTNFCCNAQLELIVLILHCILIYSINIH